MDRVMAMVTDQLSRFSSYLGISRAERRRFQNGFGCMQRDHRASVGGVFLLLSCCSFRVSIRVRASMVVLRPGLPMSPEPHHDAARHQKISVTCPQTQTQNSPLCPALPQYEKLII